MARTLLALLVLLSGFVAAGAPPGEDRPARRVSIRVASGSFEGADQDRLRGWAERLGVLLDVATEGAPVAPGAEVLRLARTPSPESWRAPLARFSVGVAREGFRFDGRSYRGTEDAIAVSDPARPGEVFVLGNGERTVLRLAARVLFGRGEEEPADYRVVSGELAKHGRFRRAGNALAVDRSTDRDEIAARDALERSFRTEERRGVRWVFAEPDRAAVAKWEPVLARRLDGPAKGRISVRVFPDATAKARATGSSRPADLATEREGVRVDLDASAPARPDVTSPVLAAAAIVVRDPALASRPTLALAAGARACGSWWGRPVRTFGAFLRATGAEPTVEEVLREDERSSPILRVGAAAAWLDAGARSEGEGALGKALAGGADRISTALARWRERADVETADAPARRRIPDGFLCGISYAMSNTLQGGYVSTQSRDTLARLARMNASSVSIMPFAFSRDPAAPEIEFVHRSARGETDEGTVRAVTDARAVGMTALVKPQIWLPGAFVGDVAMKSEADWRAWFDAYRRFVVHHAIVAEAAGAALFCVGTELSGTEERVSDWRRVIAAARLATGAPLLYASNWASGAARVAFWDALDLIGVDFYDPLSADPSASDRDLVAGVRKCAEPAAVLSRRTGKPVVFAEVGYPPVRAAWLAPHDEESRRPTAPEDAARAVTAVFRALEREPWWKGAYWWKAFSDGREARPGERGFNLLGTPSERAIAAGFRLVSGAGGGSR